MSFNNDTSDDPNFSYIKRTIDSNNCDVSENDTFAELEKLKCRKGTGPGPVL